MELGGKQAEEEEEEEEEQEEQEVEATEERRSVEGANHENVEDEESIIDPHTAEGYRCLPPQSELTSYAVDDTSVQDTTSEKAPIVSIMSAETVSVETGRGSDTTGTATGTQNHRSCTESVSLCPPAPRRQGTITSLFSRCREKLSLEAAPAKSCLEQRRQEASPLEAGKLPQASPLVQFGSVSGEREGARQLVSQRQPQTPLTMPKLSSVDEFLLEGGGDEVMLEVREMTPLEQFQQKVIQQISYSQQQLVKMEEKEEEDEREAGKGEASSSQLIPDDTILKLKDKPGEWVGERVSVSE